MHRGRLVAIVGLTGVLAGLAPGAPAFATFPGRSNGRIAYELPSSNNPAQGNIWTVNPDGTGAKQLTLGGDEGEPRWSPNGAMIAYVGPPSNPTAPYPSIWKMNADGTGKSRVVASGIDPAWSPDGKWIAYVANVHVGSINSYAVFKIRSTAPYGNAIRVTYPDKISNSSDVVDDRGPAWSNGGTTIAFARTTNYTGATILETELDTVNVSTLKVSTLVSGPCNAGEFDYFVSPNYGPGGHYLLYTYSDGACTTPPSGIYSIAVTGGSARLILAHGENPAWSPVLGKQIVYDDRSPCCRTPSAIWIANADGSGAHRIVTGVEPDWQPLP